MLPVCMYYYRNCHALDSRSRSVIETCPAMGISVDRRGIQSRLPIIHSYHNSALSKSPTTTLPSQSSARCALFLVRENSSDPPSLLASGGLKMSALRTSHVNNFPVMSTLFPILISITSKNVHDIGHSGRRRCCPSLRTFSMLSDLHDFFKLRNLYDLLYAPEHFSGAMSA